MCRIPLKYCFPVLCSTMYLSRVTLLTRTGNMNPRFLYLLSKFNLYLFQSQNLNEDQVIWNFREFSFKWLFVQFEPSSCESLVELNIRDEQSFGITKLILLGYSCILVSKFLKNIYSLVILLKLDRPNKLNLEMIFFNACFGLYWIRLFWLISLVWYRKSLVRLILMEFLVSQILSAISQVYPFGSFISTVFNGKIWCASWNRTLFDELPENLQLGKVPS